LLIVYGAIFVAGSLGAAVSSALTAATLTQYLVPLVKFLMEYLVVLPTDFIIFHVSG